MVFFFKWTHEMIVINNNLLPTIQNRERATAQDLLIRTVWCLQQQKRQDHNICTRSHSWRDQRECGTFYQKTWQIKTLHLTNLKADFSNTINLPYEMFTTHRILALGNLYVCLVIRLVTCLVPYRVVVSFLGRKQNSLWAVFKFNQLEYLKND
jgi:hypothetical protein